MSAEKRYPVRFPAPVPALAAGSGNGDGRHLKTYVQDWLTREEFETLMPGQDMVKHLCYEAVGPEHYMVLIGSEEVLSCERTSAVQTRFVNEFLQTRSGHPPRTLDEAAEISLCYDDLTPDAVLFLLKLHETVNEPSDDFTPIMPMGEQKLAQAVSLMEQEGVSIRDLVRADAL